MNLSVRPSKVSLAVCSVFFCSVLFAAPFFVSAETVSFFRNLSLGDRGIDVLRLQRLLNGDPDTTIAFSGAGSSGFETDYFGSLTRDAVNRFQQKYAGDILALGQSPVGFVGPKTRAKLNALASAASETPVSSAARSEPVAPFQTTPAPQQSRVPSQTAPAAEVGNPNFVNLDKFLSAVDKVGKKQGLSDNMLATVDLGIVTTAATTTDFRKEFAKSRAKARLSAATQSSLTGRSAVGGFFRNLLYVLGVLPPVAEAQSGGAPFGGAVYYIFLCTCTDNWLIGLQPLPPTEVELLTYYEGTQEYANYNTPLTPELLGLYDGGGQCQEYVGEDCVDIPSEGEISATLGSSL